MVDTTPNYAETPHPRSYHHCLGRHSPVGRARHTCRGPWSPVAGPDSPAREFLMGSDPSRIRLHISMMSDPNTDFIYPIITWRGPQ